MVRRQCDILEKQAELLIEIGWDIKDLHIIQEANGVRRVEPKSWTEDHHEGS